MTDELDATYHDKLLNLAAEMVTKEQVECPVKHHFGGGSYVRETLFPAGTVVMGKYHRYETVNLLMKGTISIVNTDGTLKKLTAPQVIISPPGAKCGWAHDDVIWCNVHQTDETDLDVIEKLFIDETKDITAEAKALLEAIGRKELDICHG